MGFNFGAFLGGMGQTIAERVKDQEKYVNLLTDKALDVGTQVYLDKKKEVDSNAKEIEKHMATLAMTGLDGATRFQIAQGGSTAVTNALNQYNKLLEKNKTADFNTFYSVKNSEEFKDMSDSEIISLFVPKATYDPSIARQDLKGRKVEGLGGLFVADPAELLAEYETKAGLTTEVGETRVAPALSVNYEAMQAVLGKEEKISFDTQAEAKLHYQQKIFDEQEKGDGANPILIAGYEGKIEAIDKLFTKDSKPKDFDRDKHLQSLGKNIFSLQTKISDAVSAPERVRLESELAKLTSERDFFRKEKEEEAAIGAAEKETSLETMLTGIGVKIVEAQNAGKPQSEIDKLIKQRNFILKERDAQAKKEEKDTFGPAGALSYINSTAGTAFSSEKYAKTVTPFSERMKWEFGDGREQYPSFFTKMENVVAQLRKSNELYRSPTLESETNKYIALSFDAEISNYIEKFGSKQKPDGSFQDYIKEFPSFEDAAKAASEKRLQPGDIIRYRTPDGQIGIDVWTGKQFK